MKNSYSILTAPQQRRKRRIGERKPKELYGQGGKTLTVATKKQGEGERLAWIVKVTKSPKKGRKSLAISDAKLF